MFAKSGAIVPMANYPVNDNVLSNCADMTVLVFPGSSNRFCLYEDAGDGNAYADGAFAKTAIVLQWYDTPVFPIHPPPWSMPWVDPIGLPFRMIGLPNIRMSRSKRF